MSTHSIGFYQEISKIIPQLSSNRHLISSEVVHITKTCPCNMQQFLKGIKMIIFR